ncbi:MAG: tRNA uridine-5-carboxymethylaminomethyl(34) synthesis enzyme MnmG [Planctomycetota bacterium]
MSRRDFDIVVIGGGHAGLEAAWAGANLGAQTALVTLDPARIGVMSCNPAIGGLAKGHMVREIDVLGGLMGRVTDRAGIMFKVLNTSRGPAVRGPRAQCDKHAYARVAHQMITARDEIEVIAGSAERFILESAGAGRPVCRGAVIATPDGNNVELHAHTVVLTTGTFMRGLMHEGEHRTEGGRAGEGPARGISDTLRELGFELGRLKTGTPPRLKRSTIEWESLDRQVGDADPMPFSDLTEAGQFPAIEQVECRLTRTSEEIHTAIRENLHRAPMYSGQIDSAGPRYCPSIEDKVVRFADRASHQVFLEPESHESDWVYCNGISTSLPRDVQHRIVRGMPGCAAAEILQFGYAVEYDMVRPHQILPTGETKLVEGLYLAGQINGTSGYEEAGGQGLIAGVNAVRRARGLAPWALGRDEAYIGVMMDDLVTKTPVEPYRMFTSRAEYRLMLRADNAADRLTPMARELGLVGESRWARYETRRSAINQLDAHIDGARVDGKTLSTIVKHPGYVEADLVRDLARAGVDATGVGRGVLATVLAERQYAGYIARHRAEVRRIAETEHKPLPIDLDYASITGLRAEAQQALVRFRPDTLGRARRLEGVNPADLSLIMVELERRKRRARNRAGATAP